MSSFLSQAQQYVDRLIQYRGLMGFGAWLEAWNAASVVPVPTTGPEARAAIVALGAGGGGNVVRSLTDPELVIGDRSASKPWAAAGAGPHLVPYWAPGVTFEEYAFAVSDEIVVSIPSNLDFSAWVQSGSVIVDPTVDTWTLQPGDKVEMLLPGMIPFNPISGLGISTSVEVTGGTVRIEISTESNAGDYLLTVADYQTGTLETQFNVGGGGPVFSDVLDAGVPLQYAAYGNQMDAAGMAKRTSIGGNNTAFRQVGPAGPTGGPWGGSRIYVVNNGATPVTLQWRYLIIANVKSS